MKRLFFILISLTVFSSSPLFATDAAGVDELLDAWQMDEAKKAIALLEKQYPDEPEVLYLSGRYDFLMGDYTKGVAKLDQALAKQSNPNWAHTREIAASTAEVTAKYESHTSPSGRFVIAMEPGADRVMVPYAFEALEAAYVAFAEEFGYKPPTPIRVEVYPKTATLAKVSSLTDEDIRTSGTIALCKYNRLMITSPRALLRGYGWVDTLIHEYVHYVINQKSRNRVPIWMHEGLAKFLERRWRGPEAHRMSPESEELLQERVKKNTLITFEQMHPSMAKLPSQEDAAVAFAEVYTAMEFLRKNAGKTAFKVMLEKIASGEDAKDAFASTLGMTFPAFETAWKASLKKRPPVKKAKKDNRFDEKLIFKDDPDKEREIDTIREPKAKDYFHLGQMLQSREKFGAAVVEYQKAIRFMGDTNPHVQSRLAESLLALNRNQEAVDALKSITERHPSFVRAWIASGHALLRLKKYPEAKIAMIEAARINPFDPEVHQHLATILEKLGDQAGAQREREFLQLLK